MKGTTAWPDRARLTSRNVQSYQNASRLPRDAPGLSLVGVPSLPLSWTEALPLLQSLVGKGEKIEEWQGGLKEHGLDYFTGPSETIVKMNNQVGEEIRPLWNVSCPTTLLVCTPSSSDLPVGVRHHSWYDPRRSGHSWKPP